MSSTTQTSSLNLNEAFHRYNDLAMTRHLKVRAGVSVIQSPKRGIRVVLLLDYTTSAWDPRMASAQAIGAEFLFDGMSEREYMTYVRTAKALCGTATERQTCAAQLEALQLLIQSQSAVCIHRDAKVLELMTEYLPCSLIQVPVALIDQINANRLYDGSKPLAGIYGSVSADDVAKQVCSTLAVGLTCFTDQRIAHDINAGEHPNWRFFRARAA